MKIKKSPEKIIDYFEELVSRLDWKELFHQQQMPEDNGMIIPEWYIYAQVLIERISIRMVYFHLLRARIWYTLIITLIPVPRMDGRNSSAVFWMNESVSHQLKDQKQLY